MGETDPLAHGSAPAPSEHVFLEGRMRADRLMCSSDAESAQLVRHFAEAETFLRLVVARGSTRREPVTMYKTLHAFLRAVHACSPPYEPSALRTSNMAWAIYCAAQQTTLNLLVLGRWVRPSIGNQAGIDGFVEYSFKAMNGVAIGGSVIRVPDDEWSVLVNDAWVLGGVHAHTPFYLSTARTRDNIYNNRPNHAFRGHLTVLGREMTGLTAFGYELRRDHPALGEVAVCVNAALADAADFRTYSLQVARNTADEQLWQRLCAPEHGGPPVTRISDSYTGKYLLRPRRP